MAELPIDERYIRPGTRARVSVANPDDVLLKFELTMSAAEWRHLMRQLPSNGSAAGQLGLMISAMLGDAIGKTATTYTTTGWATSPEKVDG